MNPVVPPGRLPALDGVRGIAILIVLLFHFIGQTAITNAFEAAVNRILSLGVLGVDSSSCSPAS
jgi:peptidoglycan/LPS O-acetylase OafA/YrhL